MKKLAWTLQIILALAFGASGSMKLFGSTDQLRADPRMGWVNDFSNEQVKAIGGAELAGAVGLIVPAATAIVPVLTPVAAGALGLLMSGAAYTHVRRNERPVAPLVLGLLAFTVAALRLRSRSSAPAQTA